MIGEFRQNRDHRGGSRKYHAAFAADEVARTLLSRRLAEHAVLALHPNGLKNGQMM